MKYFVFPWTQNSKSAKAIAEELQGKRILREGSSYVNKPDHLVINWGASDCPYSTALNKNITAAVNKLHFFKRLAGKGLTPDFATTFSGAKSLAYPIYCRLHLKGRDGSGIVLADTETQLVSCNLYVSGVDKTSEYRIHVGRLPDGTMEILGSQKKIKKAGHTLDQRIWCGDSVSLVWTVMGQPVIVPDAVKGVVEAAFACFPELTFGAFDVAFNNSISKAYVLEVNTAPMNTPETTKRYGDFFKKYASMLPQVEASAPTPAPAPAPIITVETVKNDIITGKLSLDTVITAYIGAQ